MDISAYLNFCPADGFFFDYPERDGGRFGLSDAEPPAGWRRAADTDWVNFIPATVVPAQGWKVHVSATPEHSQEVLEKCWQYCVDTGLMFKFLRSVEMLFVRSSKYGDRTASGKFVTIYPPDIPTLRRVLDELGSLLAGHPGPSILSDLRWREGPLYLRYGGFTPQELRTPTGELVSAIARPDGTLVADERRPGFHVPDWVEIPDFIAEAIETRNQGRLTGFPYRPTQALHFSNGGGVYRGVDAANAPVLLKEARPMAGLDITGDDAVARLEQERWAIEKLADMPEMPELIDYRRGHEHYFLVREEVVGTPLNQYAAERNPLLEAEATPALLAAYTEWAMQTLTAIDRGVATMHERDISYRDLHPGNILVRPDGTLAFIDLEAARPVSDDLHQTLGAPGYMAPPAFRGADVDRFALGIIMLDLFVPLAQEVRWGRAKVDDLIDTIHREFPVPDDFGDRVRALLTPGRTDGEHLDIATPESAPDAVPDSAIASVTDIGADDWRLESGAPDTATQIERDLVAGIRHFATPERADRLYPGDPAQFEHPTAGIAFLHGAAGVLWTLAVSGHPAPEDHVDWFAAAVDDASWHRYGFADGLSGAALALRALGHEDRASGLLEQALDLSRRVESTGRLADGLSGLGLALLTFAEGSDCSWIVAAERLVHRIADWEPDQRVRRWGPGLFGGTTGPALFFIRLYEATGDHAALEHAEQALRRELSLWGIPPGTWDLPAHVRHAPTIAAGGGTALVLDRLLRHRQPSDLERVRDRMRAAYTIPFAAEAGLLHGRAGVMLTSAGLGTGPEVNAGHARDLRLHAAMLDGHPVVTGRFALRAACDLGTGSAGVVLALAAHRGAACFPFFEDAAARTAKHSRGSTPPRRQEASR